MNLINLELMRVQLLAYALWQERGCPFGSPEVDWYRAEQILCIHPFRPLMPLFSLGIERRTC